MENTLSKNKEQELLFLEMIKRTDAKNRELINQKSKDFDIQTRAILPTEEEYRKFAKALAQTQGGQKRLNDYSKTELYATLMFMWMTCYGEIFNSIDIFGEDWEELEENKDGKG